MPAVVAGVDCHKDSHVVAVLDEVGRVVAELQTAGSHGFRDVVDEVQKLGNVTWGLESTGSYGRCFAKFLVATGATVLEVPARLTQRYRRQASRVGKSDPTDARAIGEVVLREGPRLGRFYGDSPHEQVRVLYDRAIPGDGNIQGEGILRVWPTGAGSLLRGLSDETFSSAGWSLLEACETPAELLAAGRS